MRLQWVVWFRTTLAGFGPAPSEAAHGRVDMVGEASGEVSLASVLDVSDTDGRHTNVTREVAVGR